jgi:hypothetical protein
MDRPPLAPDLAPWDYHLFSNLKKYLKEIEDCFVICQLFLDRNPAKSLKLGRTRRCQSPKKSDNLWILQCKRQLIRTNCDYREHDRLMC